VRVRGASGRQNCGAVLGRGGREAVVNVGGGVQTDAGMAMIVVVTINEVGHESAGVAEARESFREHGSVFQGLEPALAERVVKPRVS